MWKLFDYINRRGINEIAEWSRRLQKIERIKLKAKLDMLAQSGGDLPPDLLMKTEVPYIYKLKVQGNPKLRPMVCLQHLKFTEKETGDEINEEVYVILIGAKEISWKFEPGGADVDAGIRRAEVINNPTERVCYHVRIN